MALARAGPTLAVGLFMLIAPGCAGHNVLSGTRDCNLEVSAKRERHGTNCFPSAKAGPGRQFDWAESKTPQNSLVPAGKPSALKLNQRPAEGSAETNSGREIQVAWNEPDDERDSDAAPLDEDLRSKRRKIGFPKIDPEAAARVQISQTDERISLTARDVPIATVLGMIAEKHGLNIVASDEVTQRISLTLSDVRLEDALGAILESNGLSWVRHKDIVTVSRISGESKTSPAAQGRQVRVFALDYVTAADVEKVVSGLLSPVGQSFTHQTSPTDQRRTHEQIVVEDLPPYLRRVEEYLRQADTPPKQVIVEARVLQVSLKGDYKHGVNFQQIVQLANTHVALSAAGFAGTSNPTSFLRIDGSDLNALVEFLSTTTDAKTLASPKVAVLNGQEAHLQIGSRLGYLLTTTTMTSSLQSVNFLDVGVILKVTPLVTENGQILMQVKPQVSDGRINPATNLPESNTTEVETKVMLADGEALVIGGLIKEADSEVQTKMPLLGDAWLVGRLFQRRAMTRERSEIIITLLPHIVPDVAGCRERNPNQLEQAYTPLISGPLERVDRTAWEPKVKDCYRKDRSVPPPADTYVPMGPLHDPPLPDHDLEELPAPAAKSPSLSRRTKTAIVPANYLRSGPSLRMERAASAGSRKISVLPVSGDDE